MPAGTRIRSATTSETRPLPRQFSHSITMTLPLPPHVGHACVLTICPSRLSRTVLTAPAPPHVLHCRVSAPPSPSQTGHDSTGLRFPGVSYQASGHDFAFVLYRNGLVLALHALACVAGFMAGSSLPTA